MSAPLALRYASVVSHSSSLNPKNFTLQLKIFIPPSFSRLSSSGERDTICKSCGNESINTAAMANDIKNFPLNSQCRKRRTSMAINIGKNTTKTLSAEKKAEAGAYAETVASKVSMATAVVMIPIITLTAVFIFYCLNRIIPAFPHR